MIQTFVKTLTSNKLQLSIWTVIASLLVGTWSLSPESLPLSLVSQLPETLLLKTLLAFLLVSIGLILSLFVLHKASKDRIKIQEFTFVDPPGYYTHPKYSYPLCPSCLIKKNLTSPVSNGRCTVCKEPMSETLKSGGEVFTVPFRDT